MANISRVQLPDGTSKGIRATGILYGEVDSTSTSTVFTATVPGVTEYYDGLTILLYNGVVTSAANFTININGLGALGSYSNMALGNPVTPTAATRDTTIFNINYAMIFVYSSDIRGTAGWICYRGYDANTNTIGYQLRTNSSILKTADKTRYYRLLFTSANGTHWVPANTATDNSATSAKTVNQRPIDPFGRIVYCGSSTSFAAEADITATAIWDQYAFALGYSFNKTGAALTLTTKSPVYIKCAPQSDGSAIIDSTTPFVQALPSTADGKIYIFLGIAYSATNIELTQCHPVYYYSDGAIRLWSNAPAVSHPVTSVNGQTGDVVLTASDVSALPASTSIPSKTSDLTNDSGFITGISSSDVTTALGYTPYNSTNPNGYISTETDPTVPSWAKASSKPSYTASEVGAVATSAVGAASGVAPLNASSKIDSTYLPSYVDDVIEGYYYNNKFWTTSAHTIEIAGEAGKIYVDLTTNKTYRYSGTAFVEVSQGSIVSVSRDLTTGTKIATITVDGTGSDIYAPTPPTVPSTIVSDVWYNGTSKSIRATKNGAAYDVVTVATLKTDLEVPTKVSDLTNDSGFITGISSSDVTTALGYTPYNSTNPNGYISGISSSDVTTALGYTPYNSTNPNGYVNATGAANAAPVQSVNGQTGAVTITDSDEKLKTSAVSGTSPYYLIFGSDSDTASTKFYDTNLKYQSATDATLTLGSLNGKKGYWQIFNGGYYVSLQPSTLTAARTIYLPDKAGTVALTSDIPAVPTKVSDLTNDSGFISSAIYIATYGTTTYSDIAAAYNSGLVVYAKKSNNATLVPLIALMAAQAVFATINNGTNILYNVTSLNAWLDNSSTLIKDPSTKSSGQFLQYNGSAWVAADLPIYDGTVTTP